MNEYELSYCKQFTSFCGERKEERRKAVGGKVIVYGVI